MKQRKNRIESVETWFNLAQHNSLFNSFCLATIIISSDGWIMWISFYIQYDDFVFDFVFFSSFQKNEAHFFFKIC